MSRGESGERRWHSALHRPSDPGLGNYRKAILLSAGWLVLATGRMVPDANAAALSTAISYQGELRENGSPRNGATQMAFSLWDAEVGGNMIASTGAASVSVNNGRFTRALDFGAAAMDGDAKWLEIIVEGQALSPRQALTPAAAALALPGLSTMQGATETSVFVKASSKVNISAEAGDLVFQTFDTGAASLVPRMTIGKNNGKIAIGDAEPDPLGGTLQVKGDFDVLSAALVQGAAGIAPPTKGIRFNADAQSIEPIDTALGLVVNTGTAPMDVGGDMGVAGKLTVADDMDVTGKLKIGNSIIVDGDLDIMDATTGKIGFATDQLVNIGRIGVGTTTPDASIDLESSAATTDIHINNTAADGDPTIRFQLSGTTAFSMGVDDSDSDKFKIGLSAPQTNTQLTITTGGNVGIGTVNPQAPLHLGDGDIWADGFANAPTFVGRRATGTPGAPTAVTTNTDLVAIFGSGYDGVSYAGPEAAIELSAAEPWTATAHGTYIAFFTTPLQSTSTPERMRIDPDGNVGIGTSTSENRLDVEGSVAIGSAYSGTSAAPSNGLIVQGNVGIGTISPEQLLDVRGAVVSQFPSGNNANFLMKKVGAPALSNVEYVLTHRSSGDEVWMYGYDGTTFTNFQSWDQSAQQVRFPANGDDLVVDLSSGMVGIGTSSPSAQLDVLIAGIGGQSAVEAENSGNGFAGLFRNTGVGNSGVALFVEHANTGSDLIRAQSGASVAFVVRGDGTTINRQPSDGVIVNLQQGGTTEGTISVIGTTVSYNAFTGSHFGWTNESIERGQLVVMTGQNRTYHDRPNAEPIHGVVGSSEPNDSRVLGAYLGLLEPSQPAGRENPHQIMAVGNGDMWVVDTGRNIEPGDYLISSHVRGHAMLDDADRFPVGYVIARASQRVDWSAVTETVGGRKHAKIGVLFENFARGSQAVADMQRDLQDLRGILGKQVAAIAALEARLAAVEGTPEERHASAIGGGR